MKRLESVFDLNWKPRLVVEASAGTGKTYTIVGLYIRLLLEKKLSVDQILVMTFTNKATSELRGRIQNRLQECTDVLKSGYEGDDVFLKECSNRYGGAGKSEHLGLLINAIRNFDESRIFTIHGFCQRVLSEEALYAGVPFDMDIIQHDTLLLEAAEDYWRDFVDRNGESVGGELEIAKLMKLGKSPRELIGRDGLLTLFRSAGARIEGDLHPDPSSIFEKAWTLRKNMREEWSENREKVRAELLVSGLSGYTERNVTGRVRKMDDFLHDPKLKKDSFDQLKYFLAETVYDESNLTQKSRRLPEKLRFFDLCSEYNALLDDLKRAETALIYNTWKDIVERREEKSSQSGSMTYDDLLIRLSDVLKDETVGLQLRRKLLQSYPFALVDEFQDTDGIQYEIFNSIYPKEGEKSGLLMIGDPKQAIYAFRGADVYTYFRAKKEGDPETWSLGKNFRSTPGLINAVNRLFDATGAKPFLEAEIDFKPTEAGLPERENEYRTGSAPTAPFRFILKKGIEKNKNSARHDIYNQTVAQVIDILNDDSNRILDDKTNGMRRVEAGDIAVLINSHRDAMHIKEQLKEVGIDSVTYSQQKVFDTFEAFRVEMVMNAILNPFDRTAVNNALLSGLFGSDLRRLAKLSDDDEAHQGILNELQDLHEIWKKRGFMPAFRKLIRNDGRMEQIASWKDAERIFMNLHQLVDHAAMVETQQNLDPVSLHMWFIDEMMNPDKSDEQSLLLESDRNLVKISTIHGSKGLEFPIVICPDLWEGKDLKDQFIRYHKKDSGRLTLNIDCLETEDRETAKREGKIESIAEEIRKVYVALTRAKYECRVIWVTHQKSHLSGLGAALQGKEPVLDRLDTKIKEGGLLDEETLLSPLMRLADEYPHLIAVESFIETKGMVQYSYSGMPLETLQKRSYNGRSVIEVGQRVESFSSLAGHHSDTSEPDYDQVTGRYADLLGTPVTALQELTIFGFPKGPVAGTAIHKIFEHSDFRFDTAMKADHSELIHQVLGSYGIGDEWIPVVQTMIRDVTGAALGELDLSKIEPEDELREMEFHFPISKPKAENLYRIIRNKDYKPIGSSNLNHFLTGFIDLIVRQNGKYYVLDYKSNYLGDMPEDYSSGALEAEMQAAGYDLQYHLYMVALKKYLQRRIPGFSYNEHVGGACYLFVRGMQKQSSHSVYFDRPDEELIVKLEENLEGRSDG
ncbi:exodeoxyribonuclease V subunit beta [Rhodohalobacter mucosus]|uniref:DNA 3'-5' helicase n=1 Tax=Rhodohalobacter mucosus TaxID=2079485 RepID=A0A316TUR1_9BACT|nr:exodeoxyribonuclease V subunit beta [Rhodohalobacter mucosus]PWN07451.1 exodeoxyribonuclease V subunit beta [Rhodohalobacter mucosus]